VLYKLRFSCLLTYSGKERRLTDAEGVVAILNINRRIVADRPGSDTLRIKVHGN